MSILKLFPVAIVLALAGCSYPSNFANDITHMGDPTYENCRRNADVYSDYGAQCAKETDPNVKAAKAEQISQLAERNRLAAGVAQQNLAARQSAELNKGYSPITVKDFVLDGKELAARKAMRSLTGVYVPNGNLELLFGTDFDANLFSFGQKTNSPTVNLLTENASRKFRSQLLACRNLPASFGGCHVHVLGSATTCVLSGPFGNRRDVPCVSVDDGSVINSSQIFGTDLNAETEPVKREDIKNADALISSINDPSLESLATKEAKIGQASKKESKLIKDKVIYFNCIPNYDFFIYNGNVIHSKYLASIYKSGDDVEFVKRIESLKEDEHSSPYIKNHNTITWIDRDVKSEFHFDTKKLYIQYIPQDPAIQYSESVLKVNTCDCEIKSVIKGGNETVLASGSVNQKSINTSFTATQIKQGQVMSVAQSTASNSYKLGDRLSDGSIVFFVDTTKEHGLATRIIDTSINTNWEDAMKSANSLGDGWHLPNKAQLALLYRNQEVVRTLSRLYYWSSTETESDNHIVWSQNIDDGYQTRGSKVNKLNGRAIREF